MISMLIVRLFLCDYLWVANQCVPPVFIFPEGVIMSQTIAILICTLHQIYEVNTK